MPGAASSHRLGLPSARAALTPTGTATFLPATGAALSATGAAALSTTRDALTAAGASLTAAGTTLATLLPSTRTTLTALVALLSTACATLTAAWTTFTISHARLLVHDRRRGRSEFGTENDSFGISCAKCLRSTQTLGAVSMPSIEADRRERNHRDESARVRQRTGNGTVLYHVGLRGE
jgi:hypothetical protein